MLEKWRSETSDPVALFTADQAAGHFLYLTGQSNLSLQFAGNFNRLTLFLAKGAKLQLDAEALAAKGISGRNIDLFLEEGACCNVTLKGSSPWSFTSLNAHLKAKSSLTFTSFDHFRFSARVQLQGAQAHATLRGLAQLTGNSQSHTHVQMEHLAPHTTSKQLFKHVLHDHARATFNGKIKVAPSALKTDAFQRSATLLLGEHAFSISRPNLEIFADDVKASHGATVGQLDPNMLFYMKSRGIPAAVAQKFLINAFCQEVYETPVS